MCPFFIYRKDIYPSVKEKFPGYRITEITKEIADMWNELDPSFKRQYEVRAAEDRERVQREREEYENMYGKPESKRKRKRSLKRDYDYIKKYLNEREKSQARTQREVEPINTMNFNGFPAQSQSAMMPMNRGAGTERPLIPKMSETAKFSDLSSKNMANMKELLKPKK